MTYSRLIAAAPLALPLSLVLAACSQEAAPPATDEATPAAATPAPAASATATPDTASADPKVLTLEGLGDLVIGKPVPASSSFKRGEVQASDSCLTYSSPDYPGVYAMVEGDQLRRVTVGQRSDVKLVEGIGIGSTEKEVLAAFPGFKASPHEYVAPPAKYLTQPGSEPRLRFEIGDNGKVTDIHVGLEPQLGYVEGCA